MTALFDSETIEIPCPACGKKLRETIGRLKRNPKLTCRCGQVTAVNANELTKGLKSAEKAIDDLRRSLSKLGK